MHAVHWLAQSITRRLAGEKALSQGGCFLALPALLFQWAPVRPRWWTLWSSVAGSFGTLFNLPSHPPYLHLSLLHSPRVFTSTFLCPSSVVVLLFDNDDYSTCMDSRLQSGSAFGDRPHSSRARGPLRESWDLNRRLRPGNWKQSVTGR